MQIIVIEAVVMLLFVFSGQATAEPLGGDFAVVAKSLATLQAVFLEPPETLSAVLPGDALLTAGHDYLSQNVEELSRGKDAFFGTE